MEQYPVPQFIEEEARMLYFITVRQFVYLVIAGAIIFILYYILPFYLFIPAALLIGGGVLILGFIKINNAPIITIILSSIGFSFGNKNYTWKKKESLYPFRTVQRAPLKKIGEETKLELGQKSGLKKLKTKMELKTK